MVVLVLELILEDQKRVGIGAVWAHPYDVASDGRFLFDCMAAAPGRFVVSVNWHTASPDAAR